MLTRKKGGSSLETEKYIIERVDAQINWYDKKSMNAQKKYKIFQYIEIVLASLIPLLASYSSYHKLIAFVIGLFGSVIAIIESVVKLNKYHEDWIQYRNTCELLKYQKYLYATSTYPYNTKDESIGNIFIKNIETIISSENNQWKTLSNGTKESNS